MNTTTMLVKIIKPFTNGLGRTITPSANPIENITRYPRETAIRLIELGVVEDLQRAGTCMLSLRRQIARELGIEYQEFISTRS
jgi:hypothetical protein